MIVPDIDNINHVGMAVRDLRDTTSRYERLGFQLTPFSPHSGAWKPGEAVQKLNSGNRCVMFATNYLEILASEDPAAPAPRIENFLKHHQGGCIICFNSEAVQAADQRLVASGIKTSGVIPCSATSTLRRACVPPSSNECSSRPTIRRRAISRWRGI